MSTILHLWQPAFSVAPSSSAMPFTADGHAHTVERYVRDAALCVAIRVVPPVLFFGPQLFQSQHAFLRLLLGSFLALEAAIFWHAWKFPVGQATRRDFIGVYSSLYVRVLSVSCQSRARAEMVLEAETFTRLS